MKYLAGIVLCLFLCPAAIFSSPEKSALPWVHVRPNLYKLFFKTSEDDYKDSDKDLRFEGTTVVEFELEHPLADKFQIVLNIAPTTVIDKVELFGFPVDKNNGSLDSIKVSWNTTKRHLNVTCTKELVEEYPKFRLKVDFSNTYGNDMSGFYRSSYTHRNGSKRWILTTHFEPNYARKAFPSFDTPNLKAFIQISIGIPKSLKEYYALCNTPLENERFEGDLKIMEFKKTIIPMSTYLVAFTVSDFSETETLTFESSYPVTSNRNITTYGRKEFIEDGEGQLSIEAAKEAIIQLEKYLGTGYAFEKIDQVGVPDFSAGAMENWGLISYREKILFYNAKYGATATKQGNVLTITHELVHQWFGNLVTLESWNYIWLNEAFATYISYVIANKIPDAADWGYMKQIVNAEVQSRAMEVDALPSAKPMSQNNHDEDLIFAAFNEIPYAKGASILRMWDLSLGQENFRKSLLHYISKNARTAVAPADLYKSFKTVAKMEKDFFDVWHENPGYPVVEVKKNGTKFTLTQHRFLWEKNNGTYSITYVVPITISTAESLSFNTTPKHWLREQEVTLNIKSKWYIINNQEAGYYRVNYDPENWIALTKVLMETHTKIHEINRAQILNDAFSLARSVNKFYISYSSAMKLAKYLKKEQSYAPWRSGLSAFDFIRNKIYQDKPLSANFKKYVLSILGPQFKGMDSKNQTHINKLKTALVARWACMLDHQPCLNEAKKLYKDAASYPDTEETILCTVVKSDLSVWDEVLKKYQNELDSARKLMYLSALGCTRDKLKVSEYLNDTLSSTSSIRKQDRTFILQFISNGNLENVPMVLKFLEDNFERVANEYGGINPLGKSINDLAKKLSSKDDLNRMEILANKIKNSPNIKVSAESINNALSILRGNKEWAEERIDQIRDYFR